MKAIKLNIDGKDYSLGLNRDSVKYLESKGFSIEEFYNKPVTFYDILWSSLFVKDYGDLTFDKTIELQEKYVEKHGRKTFNKVVKFAFDEYTSFIDALAGTNSMMKEEELEIIEV